MKYISERLLTESYIQESDLNQVSLKEKLLVQGGICVDCVRGERFDTLLSECEIKRASGVSNKHGALKGCKDEQFSGPSGAVGVNDECDREDFKGKGAADIVIAI